MAELSKPGRLTPETMSSQSTNPTASINGWSNGGSGRHPAEYDL